MNFMAGLAQSLWSPETYACLTASNRFRTVAGGSDSRLRHRTITTREEKEMVCETCWGVATIRAFTQGGCAADYYSEVLKEREAICPEAILPVKCRGCNLMCLPKVLRDGLCITCAPPAEVPLTGPVTVQGENQG